MDIFNKQKLDSNCVSPFLLLRMGILFFLFISTHFFNSQIYVADGSLVYEANSINVEQVSNSNAEDEILINDENAKIYVLGEAVISGNQSLQNVEIVYLDKFDKKDENFVSSQKAQNQKNTVKKIHKKIIKEQLAIICLNNDFDGGSSLFYNQKGSYNYIPSSYSSYKIKKNAEQNSNDFIYLDFSTCQNSTFDIISKSYNQSYYFSLSVRPPPSSIS